MSLRVGKFAKITVNDNIVAEMGTYTMSGFARDVLEHTSFGDSVKKFVAGHVDGGEISFSGFYDPTDTQGQAVLETICLAGSILPPGYIKVYIDATTYFTVAAGGTMFVTKAKGVAMDKSGLATTDFTVKVAGAELELVPDIRSLSVSTSPSKSPSVSPSVSPSISPSASPSKSPSVSPSTSPSGA